MATVKFNDLVTDVRKRLGTHVYSRWKGINYVRPYIDSNKSNTDAQAEVRKSFSRLVKTWKGLAGVMKESWNRSTSGLNMTGYNAFISSNFEAMTKNLELLLCHGMGEDAPQGFNAATGANAGEIACNYSGTLAEERQITVFSQKKGNGGEMTRHPFDKNVTSMTIAGLEPGAEYMVYAVVTKGNIDESKTVSESCADPAMAKA